MRYFDIEEFRCKCGGLYCDGNLGLVDDELLLGLDDLRDVVGLPLIVNSGVRCGTWNALEGGDEGSQHTKGRAADICVPSGLDTQVLNEIAQTIPTFQYGGIGVYDTFVHLDSRDTGPARWDYRR